jgi:hypothetical protein
MQPATKLNESFLERINNKIHSVTKDGLLIPAKLSYDSNQNKRRPRRQKKRIEDTAENFEQQFMLRFHNAEGFSLPSMRAFSDILNAYWIRNDEGNEDTSPHDTNNTTIRTGMSFDPEDYSIRAVKTPQSSRIPRHVEAIRPASALNPTISPSPVAQVSDVGRRSVPPVLENPLPQAVSNMPPSIFIQNSIDGRNIQTPAPWANYPTSKQTLLFPTITSGPTYSNLQVLTKSEQQQLSYSVVQESEEERTNELLFFDSFVEQISKHEAKKASKKKPPILKPSKPLLNDALSHMGQTFTDVYRQSFEEKEKRLNHGSETATNVYSGDYAQDESRMHRHSIPHSIPHSLPQIKTDMVYKRPQPSVSRQSSARSSSSAGSTKSVVMPFSIPERLPSGLGPDLDSEDYKRRVCSVVS